MKKKTLKYVLLIVVSVFLAGCKGDDTLNPEQKSGTETESEKTAVRDTEGKRETESSTETETAETEPFAGLAKEEMQLGTSPVNYSQGGYICTDGARTIRVDAAGQLVLEEGDSREIIGQNVYGGLNIYEDRIYYIDDESRYLYSMKMNGSDVVEEISDAVWSLLVCEKGMLYTDKQNKSHYRNREKQDVLISDKQCIWWNIYGDWAIYAELGEESGCPVMAYHLDGDEKVQILEYGFFPVVYDEDIYYQDSTGEVSRMKLTTGEIQKVASVWGQSMLLIDSVLYFTDYDKIYAAEIASLDEGVMPEVTVAYERSDVQVGGIQLEKFWENNGAIVFSETMSEGGSRKTTLKQYDPKTGEVTVYE